jgi:hypothetical protein
VLPSQCDNKGVNVNIFYNNKELYDLSVRVDSQITIEKPNSHPMTSSTLGCSA